MKPLWRVVVFVLVIGAAMLPVPEVVAEEGCPPAGGARVPQAQPASGDFVFTGRGYGHGVGMSQFGAQGAAKLGCDAPAILKTYYPGASIERVERSPNVVVGLAKTQEAVAVKAVSGPIVWERCDPPGAVEPVICETLPVTQSRGKQWTVAVRDDASYEIRAADQVLWSGGDEQQLRARLSLEDHEDHVVLLPLTGISYKWGWLQFDATRTTPPSMFVTLDVPSVERYLRGVAEVMPTWPTEALRAQAIAARSYAIALIGHYGLRAECRCHLYASARDQNYRGFDVELLDAVPGHGWVEAVIATAKEALRYQERTVAAFYSASHGGHSESAAFAFGLDRPEFQPVDDSRWELASDNPGRSWTAAFTAEQLGQAVGIGRAETVKVLEPRGAAGRVGDPSRGYGGVRVEGAGGSVTLSGESLRRALSLPSTLFTVSGEGPAGQ